MRKGWRDTEVETEPHLSGLGMYALLLWKSEKKKGRKVKYFPTFPFLDIYGAEKCIKITHGSPKSYAC